MRTSRPSLNALRAYEAVASTVDPTWLP